MHLVLRVNDEIDLRKAESSHEVSGNRNPLIVAVSLKGNGRLRDGGKSITKEIGQAWLQN